MNKLFVPQKFKLFYKKYKNQKISILDIGCGNQSPAITKFWFPNCTYSGVHKSKHYNDTALDLSKIDHFYELNLEQDNLSQIPKNHYDIIIMTHVIEHLQNGDAVLVNLLSKLKPGGYIYIEYPAFRSVHFPSMEGTLNFFDDPTHIRLYSQIELYNLFLQNQCTVIKGGTRRDILFILLTPFLSIYNLIKYGHIKGSVMWDLMGFAEYLFVQKK